MVRAGSGLGPTMVLYDVQHRVRRLSDQLSDAAVGHADAARRVVAGALSGVVHLSPPGAEALHTRLGISWLPLPPGSVGCRGMDWLGNLSALHGLHARGRSCGAASPLVSSPFPMVEGGGSLVGSGPSHSFLGASSAREVKGTECGKQCGSVMAGVPRELAASLRHPIAHINLSPSPRLQAVTSPLLPLGAPHSSLPPVCGGREASKKQHATDPRSQSSSAGAIDAPSLLPAYLKRATSEIAAAPPGLKLPPSRTPAGPRPSSLRNHPTPGPEL